MKDMTRKELALLGKDLNTARIIVLHKHEFSCKEIAEITGISESIVRETINSIETDID